MQSNPRMYMLIGLPGSGKSTWAMKNQSIGPIISSDAVIDAVAVAAGKTYSSVFHDIIDAATRVTKANIEMTSYLGQTFILDQTNLTKKSRKGKLALLKKEYDVEAVYFDVPVEKAASRAKREGKDITKTLVEKMAEDMEPPELSEGFVSIRTLSSEGNLISIKGA